MTKRILVFTVLASVMCANISMANLVANGTFDLPDVSGPGWNTGPIDGWNTTSAGHPFGVGAGLDKLPGSSLTHRECIRHLLAPNFCLIEYT